MNYLENLRSFEGKKLLAVREFEAEDYDAFYWDKNYEPFALELVFEGGKSLIPLRDPEGNGAGFLEVVEPVEVED
jgi:hypothetical protein